jgi:hypothetical protein
VSLPRASWRPTNSENVGSQFLSLRQPSRDQHSPLVESAENANIRTENPIVIADQIAVMNAILRDELRGDVHHSVTISWRWCLACPRGVARWLSKRSRRADGVKWESKTYRVARRRAALEAAGPRTPRHCKAPRLIASRYCIQYSLHP